MSKLREKFNLSCRKRHSRKADRLSPSVPRQDSQSPSVRLALNDPSKTDDAGAAVNRTPGAKFPVPLAAKVSYWERAVLKLQKDKPEMSVVIATLKGGMPSTSTELVHEMQQVIISHKQTIEERQWTLPFRVRGRVWKIREKFNIVLRSLLAFKDCGSLLAGLDPHGIAPLVWGGVTTVMQVALDNSDAIDSALEGIGFASSLIVRYARVEDIYASDEDATLQKEFGTKLIDLYVALLNYQMSLVVYFRRSSFTRFIRAFPKLDDFQALLARASQADEECRRFTDIFDSQHARARHGELLSILQQEDEYLRTLNGTADKILAAVTGTEEIKILRWVSSVDPFVSHDNLLDRDRMGTTYADAGAWLFSHECYIQWQYSGQWYIQDTHLRQDVSSCGWNLPGDFSLLQLAPSKTGCCCLWLHGAVGTGKSAVTARVIESQIEKSGRTCGHRIAFFYCSKTQAGLKHDAITVLRSLVRQLSWSPTGKGILSCIKDEYQNHYGGSLGSRKCIDLLVIMSKSFSKVTILLDAVDECDEVNELLDCLGDVLSRTDGRLHVYLSAREHVQIPRRIKRKCLEVNLNVLDTSSDLRHFVTSEVNLRQFHHDLYEDQPEEEQKIRARIIRVLINIGRGMFQWVKLQLNIMFGEYMRHKKAINDRLDQLEHGKALSDGLTETYGEILEMNTRGNLDDNKLAVKAIRLLLGARRLLDLEEWAEAVALDEKGIPAPDPHYVLRLTRNLVVEDELLQCVRFPHFSVIDYLLQQATFSRQAYETEISNMCLTILQSPKQIHVCQISPVQNRGFGPVSFSNRDGFNSYAHVAWALHCSNAGDRLVKDETLRKNFDRFFESFDPQGPYCTWRFSAIEWAGMNPDAYPSFLLQWVPDLPCAPFVALIFRFDSILADLIRSCPTWTKPWPARNGTHGEHQTILHFAAMRGNAEAVMAILENGGDALLSEYNEWGDTPLHSAIEYDQYDIAKALLDKGANIDLVNDEKQTVLHLAAKTGNSEIIDLLFARGDLEILNTRDKEGNTPLHLAVQEERNLTVNRLLDKHADADVRNVRRETPLDIAVRTRKFRIIWLLQIYQGSDAVRL